MADNNLFKPSDSGLRSPTSNQKQNGRITNPPRYAEIGNFKASNSFVVNNQKLVKPGDTI